MSTLYEMQLTCGCQRWYPVSIHPFHGALLHCPEHGLVHSNGEPLAVAAGGGETTPTRLERAEAIVAGLLSTVDEFGLDADTISIHVDHLREWAAGGGETTPTPLFEGTWAEFTDWRHTITSLPPCHVTVTEAAAGGGKTTPGEDVVP